MTHTLDKSKKPIKLFNAQESRGDNVKDLDERKSKENKINVYCKKFVVGTQDMSDKELDEWINFIKFMEKK